MNHSIGAAGTYILIALAVFTIMLVVASVLDTNESEEAAPWVVAFVVIDFVFLFYVAGKHDHSTRFDSAIGYIRHRILPVKFNSCLPRCRRVLQASRAASQGGRRLCPVNNMKPLPLEHVGYRWTLNITA